MYCSGRAKKVVEIDRMGDLGVGGLVVVGFRVVEGLGSGEDLGSGWGLQIYRWNYGNGHSRRWDLGWWESYCGGIKMWDPGVVVV